MKSLVTIQKTCKVFHILAQIATWLSFVWAGLSALGVVSCLIWYGIGTPSGFVEEFLQTQYGGLIKTIGVLLADSVFGVTDGLLFLFAAKYLKRELADGTPFTAEGANQVRNLGIKTIVMPIVAIIISSTIYACFGLTLTEKFSNGASVILGIALILVSLILRHGAELREDKNNETQNY